MLDIFKMTFVMGLQLTVGILGLLCGALIVGAVCFVLWKLFLLFAEYVVLPVVDVLFDFWDDVKNLAKSEK